MTLSLRQRTQELFNLLPKFEHDRDEPWQQYLPEHENAYLRKKRSIFHVLKEEEDEIKSRMKHHTAGSAEHTTLKGLLKKKRNELESMVCEMLRRVRALKNMADRAREVPVAMEVDEDEVLGINNFLPSHLAPEKPPPETPVQPRSSKPAAKERAPSVPEPEEPPKPARDTYLDGVKPEDVNIMLKMRPLAEKFDCRDKIFAALASIRKRDFMVNMLKDLSVIAKAEQKNSSKK